MYRTSDSGLALLTVAAAMLGLASGTVVAGTVYVPGDYPTIQAAIDACGDGDEVVVGDGTWSGVGNKDLDFNGRLLWVHSANGAENCTIDCEGSGRGFYFHSGETADAVVDGFTICNGDAGAEGGGGLHCVSSSPTVTRCTFSANSAYNGGGLACWTGSSPAIDNCTFSGNSATYRGGGMWCGGSSSPTVTDCTFSGNSAAAEGGGLLCVDQSDPSVDNCTFRKNAAANNGGGMWCGGSSDPVVVNCTFSNNTAVNDGGGMVAMISCHPTVTDCTFSSNSATNDAGMFVSEGSNPTVTDCRFENNSASESGGGLGIGRSSHPTIEHCVFRGNTAGWAGAGMLIWYECNPAVEHCIFANNIAEWRGGGIMNWTSCNPNVFDCLFIGNEAGFGGGNYPGGGGMFNFNYCSPTVVNCTFTENLASPDGGAIRCHYYGNTTVTNCILWGDDPDEIALSGNSTITVRYSDVEGGWYGVGNIDEDPLWVDDGPLGDYYLSQTAAGQDENSPCVNAGSDTAENLGLDTRTTRTDQIPDSGIVDMGYHYPIECLGDLDGDGDTDHSDLGILLADWGCVGSGPEDCPGDLDGDFDTDHSDLGILLADWGCGT